MIASLNPPTVEVFDTMRPAAPGTADIAPETARWPTAAAPCEFVQPVGERLEIGIGVDAEPGCDQLFLFGLAGEVRDRVIARLPHIVEAGADAADELADAGDRVLGRVDRMDDQYDPRRQQGPRLAFTTACPKDLVVLVSSSTWRALSSLIARRRQLVPDRLELGPTRAQSCSGAAYRPRRPNS